MSNTRLQDAAARQFNSVLAARRAALAKPKSAALRLHYNRVYAQLNAFVLGVNVSTTESDPDWQRVRAAWWACNRAFS